MKNKKCNKCKLYLPLTEFHKSKRNRLGLKTNCKKCRNIEKQKYRHSNNGKIKHNLANKKYTEIGTLFRYGNINNSDFICSICGKQPIEKHHENYEYMFCFIPLCHEHHIDSHRR